MKFAYLHGYQGFVTDEKREYLDSLGDCFAPTIDYDNAPTLVQDLMEQFTKEPIDFIAGTSLGGMLSYYLGLMLNVPVLMFNPAVIAIERLKPFLPEQLLKAVPSQRNLIFTGLKDDVVEPQFQIDFVENLKQQNANIEQIFYVDMTHLVTLQEFKKAFETFLKK
ncbi:YqiA/YcfP family alpha/beta fold hydrolase [Algoriella sp.]|uniref:YqiA/YcfP family alpha/beta fold hydrolase n=1 Tax=Algoriella sp. TaxID=1872434 RepID=UPI002FC6E9FA